MVFVARKTDNEWRVESFFSQVEFVHFTPKNGEKTHIQGECQIWQQSRVWEFSKSMTEKTARKTRLANKNLCKKWAPLVCISCGANKLKVARGTNSASFPVSKLDCVRVHSTSMQIFGTTSQISGGIYTPLPLQTLSLRCSLSPAPLRKLVLMWESKANSPVSPRICMICHFPSIHFISPLLLSQDIDLQP